MSATQVQNGQRHERLDEGTARLLPVSSEQSVSEDGTGEITVVQRMLSATTGSLLTSLLVTPLDVVRVRLQSQTSPHASSQISSTLSASSASASHNANIASATATSTNPSIRLARLSNIGVTTCCREVFWANNVAAQCYATPTAATMPAMQAPSHITSISPGNCAVEETQRKVFNSTIDGLQKIARSEGLTSLWRGLSPTLLMAIPANIIYFSGYDALRYGRASPIRQYVSDTYNPLIAGSLARAFAAVFVSPIEMFRTRMQASSGGQKGIIQQTLLGMKDLVAVQGYSSLWRGLTLTMWRDVPFSGVYWWGYEVIRNKMTDVREQRRGRLSGGDELRSRSQSRDRDGHTVTLVDSFIAGAISGSVASIMTMPFDVGKTRQQVLVNGTDSSGAASAALKGGSRAVAPEDMSMPRFLLHIFREEGVAGLFKGWIPRTMKVAPACAIMISSYELGKKFASKANVKKHGQAND